MKDKIPILHIWADPADAERLIRELAEAGVNFKVKLVKTEAEYVAALVRTKFRLIIADERAETAPAGTEELSLFQIAEQISPETPFLLLADRADAEVETAGKAPNFSAVSRQDLHLLQSVMKRALSNSE